MLKKKFIDILFEESIELIEEIYFHVDQLENVEMICRKYINQLINSINENK